MFIINKMNQERINFLANNLTIEVDDIEIINIYRQKCIVCRKPTITIHEINPKSLIINWKKWINRVLLCSECHNKAHKYGTISSRNYLIAYRNQRLIEYWNICLTH